MSYGLAYPSIAEIVPTVGFPASVTGGAAGTGTYTGTGAFTGTGSLTDVGQGVGSAVDGVGASVESAVEGARTAASQSLDAAGELLQGLLEPAAVALGALSGALLVGRAAMVATEVLAAAAVRAADEQRCLERAQEVAATATAQWEAAAFAAVRANARRASLLARVRRAAFRTLPDTPPPPLPDLPPPLTCAGTRLDVLRRDLAVLEEALENAEAAQARWTMEQALHAAGVPEDEAWRRRMLDRREAAVRALRAVPAGDAPAVPPAAPAADGLDRRRAEESGAELLALLEPGADPKEAELAVAAVRHAVACAAERPAKARNHLREARRFVMDANRAVRSRLAAQEKAAVQLDFLLTEAPLGEPPLPPAGEEIALLREALAEGRTLDAGRQSAVDRRVRERLTDLEGRYTRELLGLAVARLADPAAAGRPTAAARAGDGGGATAGGPGGPLCFDVTPAGWWPGHWLRITVHEDRTELVTMYAEGGGPRGAAELALDARRCHEAREHVAALREAGLRWGIELPTEFRETGSAVPGVRGGDGAVVLGLDEDAGFEGSDEDADGRNDGRPEAYEAHQARQRNADGRGRGR